jgi:hypothetical protein
MLTEIGSLQFELVRGRGFRFTMKKFCGYHSEYIDKCRKRLIGEIERKRMILELLRRKLLTLEEYIIIEPPSETFKFYIFSIFLLSINHRLKGRRNFYRP